MSDNIAASIEDIKRSDPDTLVLYLLNKERFFDIGALNLYQAFDNMEKYSFGRTHSAVNVLTASNGDNPDPLMKLLYCVVNMAGNYQTQQYGLIIQTLKANKSMFCRDSWNIKTHNDKVRLFNNLNEAFSILLNQTKTIADLLAVLESTSIIDNAYMEGIQTDEENQEAFCVPAIEVMRVAEYLNNPKISTQHGVKGESHDSVVFVADDSYSNPIVHMYRFFEMWSQLTVTLRLFNEFYYAYTNELADLQNMINLKISDLKKDSYSQHEQLIHEKVSTIMTKFECNPYFKFLCRDKYNQFFAKPGVTKAKECLKESTVFGVLSAYKLFYVGCSRARKNLTILLNRSKVKGDLEAQKNNFVKIGFTIQ